MVRGMGDGFEPEIWQLIYLGLDTQPDRPPAGSRSRHRLIIVISPLILLLGIPITLFGLVGMGPQVNVHRIRPGSIAAWVFRIGGALMIIGLLLNLWGGLERALVTVSLIIGTACVVSC